MPNFSDQAVRLTTFGRSCPKITRQSWKSGDVTKSFGRGGGWYVRGGGRCGVKCVLCVGMVVEGLEGRDGGCGGKLGVGNGW